MPPAHQPNDGEVALAIGGEYRGRTRHRGGRPTLKKAEVLAAQSGVAAFSRGRGSF